MSTELQRQESRQVGQVERTRARPVVTPPVDIYETNEQIVLLADMPGADNSSIDVTLEQDVLTIEGRVPGEEPSGHTVALAEFGTGDYRRVFTLATDVERDRISAEMKDGVLKVVLPKAEPARAKKITVKAG